MVFTAKDDNSVGESIGSGNPSGYYANIALAISGGQMLSHSLNDLRVAYAKTALAFINCSSVPIYNAQFNNCQYGIALNTVSGTETVENALFANVQTNFNLDTETLDVQNATFNNIFCLAAGSGSGTVALTNCILANVTNGYSGGALTGGNNGFYNTPEFGAGAVTNTFYPFQRVGAGSYYLTNNSPYRDAGTTNIDSTLLAELATKTTYPPLVYSNTAISVSMTFSPQAQRDTDTPDLGYAYNGAGDLLTLTDGKNQTTTWGYDSFGRVTNKVDAAGITDFVYQYDADNRLTNRWTPAKGNTAYAYDAVGNLTHIAYPVSPSISLAYDVLNRLTNMVDAVGTTVYSYDGVGQLLSEDGPWANDTVSYSYANRLRTGLSVQAPNASAWTQSYAYDSARRLTSAASAAGSFNYTLGGASPASPLVKTLSLPNGALITNSYDNVARMLSTKLLNSSGAALDSENYAFNAANQRTAETNAAGDFRNYVYDNAGELLSAVGKEPGGTTNRLNEQFGYAYDAAGNLNYRTNNALVQDFGVNNLNELSTITRSGTLTVAGTTTSDATNVTVNSLTAYLYSDATFARDGFTLVDGDNSFTAIAKDVYGRADSNSVTVNLPATDSLVYDLNGNLCTNGSEVLVWNDENELVTNFVGGSWKSEFVYDGKLRRRIQRDYSWNGSAWVQTNEIHFLYDGDVIIQQRSADNLPVLTLTRGNDSSGSLKGAGGIGGLLAMTEMGLWTVGSGEATSFYHCDGNGNVTMLIGANQLPAAKAEYDPYGDFLSLSGSKAGVNPFWYSSKPIHWQSGEYDFLYRWYSPGLQRWPNRDPLNDQVFFRQCIRNMSKSGFVKFRSEKHMFPELSDSFAANSPINYVDMLGLNAASSGVQICFQGIHEFIGVDGQGYGFYPKNDTILNIIFGPGRVTTDSVPDANCHNVNTPCGSDPSTFKNCVNNAIQNSMNNPPPYQFILFNCSSWVNEIIDSCNPNWSNPLPIPD